MCPDHQQHACVGTIEVNTACNMGCPFCFAGAGHGYSLALAGQVQFEVGDAEGLDYAERSLMPSCAKVLSAPSRTSAVQEMARVLKPGGVIGLSDLTRNGPLSAGLETLLAWAACVANARPLEDYLAVLAESGLVIDRVENHDRALLDLAAEIRTKLLGPELMARLGGLELPFDVDWGELDRLAKLGAGGVRQGHLG